jgi:hypothetical protein
MIKVRLKVYKDAHLYIARFIKAKASEIIIRQLIELSNKKQLINDI